jgi:hypothetical protein
MRIEETMNGENNAIRDNAYAVNLPQKLFRYTAEIMIPSNEIYPSIEGACLKNTDCAFCPVIKGD